MKIVIVGGGAMGRLFGYFLVKGGNQITLVDIDRKTLGALQDKGIGLVDDEHPEEAESFPVRALFSANSLTEADLVLLMVKSQAALAAVKDVTHLVSRLVFCNDGLLTLRWKLNNLAWLINKRFYAI